MNITNLNDAMQYIDDQYLDIADAPQKEIIQMSKVKTITRIFLIAAVIAMLAVTVYAADLLHVKSLFSWTKTTYEVFPELEEAMDEAGFRMDAKENFRTGYAFEKVGLKEVRGEDENNQEVLTYSAIFIHYRNEAGNCLILTAEPVMAEISATDHSAAQTKEIGKITADYFVNHYKYVPEEYELTEEDKVWMEHPGNFLSYGSDEIEETAVGFLIWVKDGIHYGIMDPSGAEQPETLFAMAEELILTK